MLVAAAKHPRIKRIIITSSVAAVLDLTLGIRPGYVYTEDDWNPVTWDEAVSSKNPAVVYCASKVFAEKAAWEYVKQVKPPFDIVTLQPPIVFGPIVHHISNLSGLNESNEHLFKVITDRDGKVPETAWPAFVDVRDLADAHVLALQKDDAGGHRFVIAGGSYTWQQVVDILRDKFPNKQIPVGTPNAVPPSTYRFDSAKAEKYLGLKWTALDQTVTDTTRQLFQLQDDGK